MATRLNDLVLQSVEPVRRDVSGSTMAEQHLGYSKTNVEKFQQYVALFHRTGHMEFRTHFDRGHLDPLGGVSSEQLGDDRIAGA